MKVTGLSNRYHITNVMGIDRDKWDVAMPFSGLYSIDNKLQTRTWERKLGTAIEFRDFKIALHGQSKWFWFRNKII